jgi:hypothetical protein
MGETSAFGKHPIRAPKQLASGRCYEFARGGSSILYLIPDPWRSVQNGSTQVNS